MKWFGFSLNILGLFISSNVLAMDAPPITKADPGDTPRAVGEAEESLSHKQLDLNTPASTDFQGFFNQGYELPDSSSKRISFSKSEVSYSRTFYEHSPRLTVSSLKSSSSATPEISGPKLSSFSLEKFSFDTPDVSHSQTFFEKSPKHSHSFLKSSSFAIPNSSEPNSKFSLEKFSLTMPEISEHNLSLSSLKTSSFAESSLDLGSSSGPPPLELHFHSYLPKPPKSIIREGITLPKVDLGHLGISKLFNELGIPIEKYDFRIRHLIKYETLSLLGKFESKKFETSSLLGNIELKKFEMPSLLDTFCSKEKRLSQKAIPDLTDEEIIFLFKHLSSCSLCSFSSDAESMIKLEELLQDARARHIILETSKGSEDLISTALKETTGILANPRKLKTLIAADGFLEHLLSRPADEKGETVLSKAFLNDISFTRLESVTIFFENRRICEHLSSIPDEKYQSIVMKALITAVLLPCGDTLLPLFYKSKVIFGHLVSCFSRGDLYAQATAKAYTKAGLLMALSERTEGKINTLLHEDVLRFIREETDCAIDVMKKAIKGRNSYLARRLLADLKLLISPVQIKEALQVSAIWEILSDENQRTLLATAQKMDPNLTEEGLIRHHKKMSAYEHAIVGHPSVINDMETLAFEGYEKYKKLLTEALNPFEREAQKKALEREFLKVLCGKAAPWFHAEAEAAYDLRMFGQGVNGLVVELDVLPEHHRKGLLHPHLGEETVYKEEVTGSRSAHNIGVTSLVAQMAPLAAITSTSTSHLKKIAENITAGRYPFINCSWGPCAELKLNDRDSPFGSVQLTVSRVTHRGPS